MLGGGLKSTGMASQGLLLRDEYEHEIEEQMHTSEAV